MPLQPTPLRVRFIGSNPHPLSALPVGVPCLAGERFPRAPHSLNFNFKKFFSSLELSAQRKHKKSIDSPPAGCRVGGGFCPPPRKMGLGCVKGLPPHPPHPGDPRKRRASGSAPGSLNLGPGSGAQLGGGAGGGGGGCLPSRPEAPPGSGGPGGRSDPAQRLPEPAGRHHGTPAPAARAPPGARSLRRPELDAALQPRCLRFLSPPGRR